ncbi:MAG: hypothetical protein SPK61_00055 [Bacteroidales bacterium]|nr:hypothetical protein [Bacteroidales bacterium]MDY6426395.1 hypothetical protein [Bacteroidales bacterium]
MKIKQLTTLKHKLQWLLLLAVLLGVSQGVWGYDVYMTPNGSWWANDNAKFNVWAWEPGQDGTCYPMAVVEGDGATATYFATIPDNRTNLLFRRHDTDCGEWNKTSDLNFDSSKPLYEFASDGNSGTWKAYTPPCSEPTVTANNASDIRPTSATISGSYSGGSGIGTPTFTVSGGTLGAVSCSNGTCTASLTDLTAGTTYNYTFDVPNDCGPTRSSQKSFSTCYKYFDGDTYLYIDVSAVSWFTDASAVPNMNFDGGSWGDASLVTGKIYRIKPAAGCYSTFGIRRHGSDYWNTCSNNSFLGIGANNELVLSDNWSENGCSNFTWSTYNPCTPPTVTTTNGATNVTSTGAIVGGTVTTEDGDCEVTDAGIAYGTSTNPTTPASYGEPTSGEEFEVNILGLSAGTRYYYRAYVTAGGITTYGDEYSFYTNPSELYIKGPLVYDSKWDPYTQDNVGYSHTAGTNTFVFSFNARTGGGGHSDYREYCVSTTDGEGGKIQSSMDGTTSGWSFENGSGSNFVASSTIVSTDNTAIDITITYNNSTGQYHMVLAGACSGAPTINNGDIASKNWTKCGNENGRELSITASGGSGTLTYQWFRNTAASETGATAVTDMVVAAEGGNTYSPSSTDYGTYYYYCVVRSGGACSSNKATSGFTGAITIKQTPTVTPAAVTVKQYEPVTLTATNSSVNWSITAHPDGATADEYYLYDDTKSSAMFKGKTGSYTITATSTGSDCTSTSTITVNNDDSEGC